MSSDWSANIRRFTGFADLYDRHRAAPPTGFAPLLAGFIGGRRPRLVVDLGSGTGLSTRYWADKADRVVGIEPSPDMRRRAREATGARNVRYMEGFSHETGLPGGGADIVTCMQALHWMEPGPTFREAVRILRPNGVFAACDYDWPPTVGSRNTELRFSECCAKARRYELEGGIAASLNQWDKSEHLDRMGQSGCFKKVQELSVTHTDEGNAERLVGLLLTQGYVQQVLGIGISEADLGIDELRRIAEAELGTTPRIWHWNARVRIGFRDGPPGDASVFPVGGHA